MSLLVHIDGGKASLDGLDWVDGGSGESNRHFCCLEG